MSTHDLSMPSDGQPAVAVMTEPSPEERLERCVDLILKKPDFPAFAEQIEETMQLLENEEISARKLGEVVSRNYGLTLKVLQVANAFGNNPTGVPVFSVENAIFRLGVERVRSMASGMVFFEHFRGQSEAVKELVLLSLVTANQAEAAAEKLKFAKPEEAYLCGMLRNMGEILIASYFPEELARIRAEASTPGTTVIKACRSIMGFTYDELGAAMVKRWKMPSDVGACMTPDTDAERGNGPFVVKLAHLAHGLTNAIYRSPNGDSKMRVTLLVQKYGTALDVTKEGLEQIATTASAEARKTLMRLKLTSKDLLLLDKSKAMQAFGKNTGGAKRPMQAAAGVPSMAMNPRVFAQLEREVDDLLRTSKGPGDLQAVVLTVLDAIQRGAGFDRALFALVTQERDLIQGRLAVGVNAEELKSRFLIPMRPAGGPIGAALARNQELTLRSDWDLQAEEVAQLMQLGARMMSVLPLTAKGQLIGCLYYDQTESISAPTSVVESALRRLRDRTVQVLSRKR